MAKNSRRRRQPQLPSLASDIHPPRGSRPPQDEQTSSEDGYEPASITLDGIDLEVVMAEKIAAAIAEHDAVIAEKIEAAIAKLPVPLDPEAIRRLVKKMLSASSKTSHRRKTGPNARWRMFAARDCCNFYVKHGRDPTAEELIKLCQDEIIKRGLLKNLKKRKVLDDGSVYELLRFIGAT